MYVAPELLDSLDTLIRADLQSLRDSCFGWLLFSSVMVAVGVFMEGPELIREIGTTFRSVKRETPPRIAWVGLLGWMFVFAGVAGELVAEAFVSKVDAIIQTFNDVLLVDTQGKTALANRQAGDAKESAGSAKTSAVQAATAASFAISQSGAARQQANVIRGELEDTSRELSMLRSDEQGLDSEVQKRRAELTNLAVCTAPRIIPFWSTAGKTSLDPLRPYAGRVAIIEFLPDAEARRAALNIAGALSRAKWTIKSLRTVDGLRDGVEVQPYQPPREEVQQKIAFTWQADELADALIDFLQSFNWNATFGWPVDNDGKMIGDDNIIPPGAVRIQVGLYPAVTYVGPPGSEELNAALAELNKAKEIALEKIESQEIEREGTLDPELRRRAQEARKRSEADRERILKRSRGPCQPLTPPLF